MFLYNPVVLDGFGVPMLNLQESTQQPIWNCCIMFVLCEWGHAVMVAMVIHRSCLFGYNMEP